MQTSPTSVRISNGNKGQSHKTKSNTRQRPLCTSQACKTTNTSLVLMLPTHTSNVWYKLEVAEVPFKCAFLLDVLIPVLSPPSLLIAKDSSWTLRVLVRSFGRWCHTKPISLNNHLKLLPQKNTTQAYSQPAYPPKQAMLLIYGKLDCCFTNFCTFKSFPMGSLSPAVYLSNSKNIFPNKFIYSRNQNHKGLPPLLPICLSNHPKLSASETHHRGLV